MPRGWQVTHSPLGLQLVPPDAGYGPHGPAEVYLLNVQPVPGVTRPDDPRILGFVEGSLRQLVPTLAAEGAATPCGPGTRMLWRGTNPMTGAEVLAVALLQIAHDSVVGIIGLGERARVEQRSAALERIFASYRRGEGQRDPALVGTWHYWSYSGTSSLITGSSTSSETRRTVMLGADGSLIERSSHEGIGNFHDSSGGVRDYLGGYASQRSDGRSGSWSAGDGMLFVSWSDGQQSAWRYQLSGLPGSRHLTLHEVSGGGKPMEWSEQPVVV